MITLIELKTKSWFGFCIGTYNGKYRPTAYKMKKAAKKLMKTAIMGDGNNYFAYYCGKDGQVYKCAIDFVDGELIVYNIGTFKELGLPTIPRFRKLPPIKNGGYKGGMGTLYRG